MTSSRIEVNGPEIVVAESIIDSITLRLHSPRPVSAQGVAMLRILLTAGGVRCIGMARGDLPRQLAAAFDAL